MDNYKNYLRKRNASPAPNGNSDEFPTYPADEKTLLSIRQGIEAIAGDLAEYEIIKERMTQKEDGKIIDEMILDAKKHRRILEDLYLKLTGIKPEIEDNKVNPQQGSCQETECILREQALKELENVEFLRNIYFSFLNIGIRDMLYEVITDKQANSVKLLYLLSKIK